MKTLLVLIFAVLYCRSDSTDNSSFAVHTLTSSWAYIAKNRELIYLLLGFHRLTRKTIVSKFFAPSNNMDLCSFSLMINILLLEKCSAIIALCIELSTKKMYLLISGKPFNMELLMILSQLFARWCFFASISIHNTIKFLSLADCCYVRFGISVCGICFEVNLRSLDSHILCN